jgi:hypothetical protein
MESLHPDHRTDIPKTEYFFLGSGKLSAAIQWSRHSECSPLGIILWQPEHFTRKNGSFLFHPELGLSRTMITVIINGVRYQPTAESLSVEWSEYEGVPNVFAVWKAGEFSVVESFYIPIGTSTLMLWICVRGAGKESVEIETALYANPILFSSFGSKENFLYAAGYSVIYLSSHQPLCINERRMTITPADFGENDKEAHIVYVAGTSSERVEIETNFIREREYWQKTTSYQLIEDPRLTSLFNASKYGLRSVVASNGRFDASTWQYGMEWGRDAGMIAEALVYSGQFELARNVLVNILTTLSNDEGMIAEASRFRGGRESELDSNGIVLNALKVYNDWTGDTSLIIEHKKRIVAVADYLLRDEFCDIETGMLIAARDIWERSEPMGIKPGFDVAHQVFAIVGLSAAASLSDLLGADGKRWSEASEKIRHSFLYHPKYSFIEEGRIIKRRLLDGSVQRTLTVDYDNIRSSVFGGTLPNNVPLASDDEHCLEPDVTQLLPITYGIVARDTDIAQNTLTAIEKLWGQHWDDGGYGRYDISGEPDSPGPWSLATLLVACAQAEVGNREMLQRSLDWLVMKADAAGSWMEFYGIRPTPPLPPVGILPWSWAQYIILITKHIARIRRENETLISDTPLYAMSGRIRFRESFVKIPH